MEPDRRKEEWRAFKSGKVNKDFVARHVNFRIGNEDIGYGLRPEHSLERSARNAKNAGGSKKASFEESCTLD